MSIKAGDVVQMRSGGPKMTVEKVNDDGTVQCAWMNNRGSARSPKYAKCSQPFAVETLVAAGGPRAAVAVMRPY